MRRIWLTLALWLFHRPFPRAFFCGGLCFFASSCAQTETSISTAPESVPNAGRIATPDRDPKVLAEGIMREFDENHDGKLSELEYAHATLAVFQSLDRNGDGRLSEPECRGLLPGDEITTADRNADGFITLLEMFQDREDAFLGKDLNGDGVLNLEEVAHSVAKKQKRGHQPRKERGLSPSKRQ